MKMKIGLCALMLGLVASIASGGVGAAANFFMPYLTGSSEIPEQVLYESVFRLNKGQKKRAEKQRHEGKPETSLTKFFKDKLDLTDEESAQLDRIADEYDQAIRPIDEKAQKITKEYRKQFPNNRVPEGQTPPPPPVELGELQNLHDAIVLEHRDKLRTALGQERFETVDKKVKTDFAKNFRKMGDLTPARGNQ